MINLFDRPEAETGKVFVNFNHVSKSLSVAFDEKLTLYNMDTVDSNLKKLYQISDGKVIFMEHVLRSALVVLVMENSPRTVSVVDFRKPGLICEFSYSESIVGVKVNGELLVICLENEIFIHDLGLQVMHHMRDVPPNPDGIIAISPKTKFCYLAYPGFSKGEVIVYDALHLHAKFMIPAHEFNVVAVTFSTSGEEIATACEAGTAFKVFSSKDGAPLFVLVRGIRQVSIVSISFSTCSEFLIASSNTQTVHIFRLDRSTVSSANSNQSTQLNRDQQPTSPWSSFTQASSSMFSYITKAVTSYLPTPVSNVFTHPRAFATITLEEPGIRRTCAIAVIEGKIRVLIATQQGKLYIYGLPSGSSSECTFIKKYDLRNHEDFDFLERAAPVATPQRSEPIPINRSSRQEIDRRQMLRLRETNL